MSTILPQSSSDLDTDQGEIIDEMLKQVVQTFNETLMMTTTSKPTSNLNSNKTPHYNTSDRQPAPTVNTSDFQMKTITPPKDAYNQTHLTTSVPTQLQTLKKKTKLLWT